MALIDDVKDVIKESGNDSDTEVKDLIDAAKADMILCGVRSAKVIDTDPLIKRAIMLYSKAQFGYDDPKIADRFQKSYESLRNHLSMSTEYTEV